MSAGIKYGLSSLKSLVPRAKKYVYKSISNFVHCITALLGTK